MIGRPSSVSPSFACAAPFSPLGHHYKLWLYLFLALPWIATGIGSVRMHVVVPDPGISGEDIQLECKWSAGTSPWYSLNWYKDNYACYRYTPRETRTKYSDNCTGVNIDLVNSNDRVLTLRGIDLSTEGTYRCEVMFEAPGFFVEFAEANLTVIEMPRKIYMKSMKKSYREGDTLQEKCTVKTRPAAELSFQVNGKSINSPWVKQLPSETSGGDTGPSLTTTSIELSLPLDQSHVPVVEIKCIAKVYNITREAEKLEQVLSRWTENAGVPSVSPPIVVLTLISAAVAHLLNT